MPASGATLGLLQYVGLVLAIGLAALGMVVLWYARHRNDEERIELPVLGNVGNPTCLTLGLCLLIGGYHVAAYALVPVVTLVGVPVERWWLLVLVSAAAVGGSLWADRLEGHRDTAE